MPSKAFDPVEFAATMARMAERTDAACDNPTPFIDPAVQRDVVQEMRGGRKIEDYKRVLEHYGFRFVPARHMVWDDGRPKADGEWRSPKLRMAFTETEVLGGFRSPEDFDRWIQETMTKRRARAAGLTLLS